MKQTDQQADEAFREQCRRQMDRPMEQRIRYGFVRTYKPVLDDAPWRSFDSTAAYRDWCEANLPEYLGYRRAKSLSENSEGRCGEGFWPWPRRRGRSIPAAGYDGQANAGHGQKTRRPEGFRGKGRLASLLLSRRSTRDILPRPASPYGLFRENSTLHNLQTGSK
jgi:hypothetical protein